MTVALVLTLTSQLTRQYLPCSIARESLEHGRWLWLLLQWDSQVHPFLFIGHPRHVHQGIFGWDRLPVVPGIRVGRLYLSLCHILLPPRPALGYLEHTKCWLHDLISWVGCEVPSGICPCCGSTPAWRNICVLSCTIFGSVLMNASCIVPMIMSFTASYLHFWMRPSLYLYLVW